MTLVGGAVATAGLATAALVSTKPALFGGLAAGGIGAAVVPITGSRAIFATYGADRRAWAFGVRQTAVPLGGLVAIAALPILVSIGGLALPFWVLTAATALSSAWLAAIVSSERSEAGSERLGFRRIWRAAGMRRLFAVAACYILVVQALVVYTLPSARAAGMSELEARLTFLGVALSAVVGRVVWGYLADRGGGASRQRVLVQTGVMAAVGAGLFAAALHAGPVPAMLAAALMAFGAFGWNAIVYVMAAEHAPAGLVARSLSVAFALVFLLSAAGTPALGVLAEEAGWDAVWLTTGALTVAGAVIAASAGGSRPAVPRA